MTTKNEFFKLINELDVQAYKIMDIANDEYAAEGDKFENFKTIAAYIRELKPSLNVAPEDIALVYFMKHLSSIVKGISKREDMRGRYIDAMNYLRLHYGIISEREDWARSADVPTSQPPPDLPPAAVELDEPENVPEMVDVRAGSGLEDFQPGSGEVPNTGENPWQK